MYPIITLEWFHDGEWHKIGCDASDPQSAADLRAHAEALAAEGRGCYRLMTPSIYAGHPAHVVQEWRS